MKDINKRAEYLEQRRALRRLKKEEANKVYREVLNPQRTFFCLVARRVP